MTSWEVVGAFGSMWFSPDNSRDVDIDNVNSENPTSLVWDSVQRILKKTL